MSLLDTLRKNLTPELYTQVTDKLGDDFDFDLVPRSRLNKVIAQRNTLRDQIAGGSQPQGGNPKDPDADPDEDPLTTPTGKKPAAEPGAPVDVAALKKQWEKEQGDAVSAVKIQFAALEKLRAANAIDPELIWSSSIIDKSKLSIDDKGALVGMDELLVDLTKSRAHLFTAGKPDVPPGTGKDGGGTEPPVVSTREDFLKLDTTQQLAFKQANPEVFKTFLNA